MIFEVLQTVTLGDILLILIGLGIFILFVWILRRDKRQNNKDKK